MWKIFCWVQVISPLLQFGAAGSVRYANPNCSQLTLVNNTAGDVKSICGSLPRNKDRTSIHILLVPDDSAINHQTDDPSLQNLCHLCQRGRYKQNLMQILLNSILITKRKENNGCKRKINNTKFKFITTYDSIDRPNANQIHIKQSHKLSLWNLKINSFCDSNSVSFRKIFESHDYVQFDQSNKQ